MDAAIADRAADLRACALRLAARGKGILAADESVGTVGKRLVAMGLQNDAETRRAYRQVLLCADNAHTLSGAILFHETLLQCTADGIPFPQVLAAKGVLVGIKVDTGLQPMPDSPAETFTSGLDRLDERCREYYDRGATFAKWRAALKIDDAAGLPSEAAVRENAVLLAKYAKIAQASGLLPIVEPEILIDGSHSADVSARVSRRVIKECYRALREQRVLLSATLLKPMMIMPGISSPERGSVTSEQIARWTLDCMRAVVPDEVPGIMFLSGGMSEVEATRNLNALNKLADAEGAPWTMSFSFGRALQSSALKKWAGKNENAKEASTIAAALATANATAQLGKFTGKGHPSLADDKPLYEGYRGWRSGEDPNGT